MPLPNVSKLIGLIALGAIAIGAILVLVIVYSKHNTLCPMEGYLMSRETNHCYLRESKGPCKNNLIFLEEASKHAIRQKSQYGQCDCPYTQYNRTIIYHPESESCYFVFTQAFCDEGQWLTVKKEVPHRGTPLCEENKCLQHSANRLDDSGDDKPSQSNHFDSVQWVPVKGGGCAQLGETTEGCDGAVVRFHPRYILPSCKKPVSVTTGSIGVPSSSCNVGSYWSIMGKCQAEFSFDFE